MSFISILKKVAPTIAGIAGGPFGSLAKDALKKVFKEDMDDARVQEVLASSSPDTLLKLKQAEMELTKILRELDIREEELGIEVEMVHQQDRASARDREAAIRDHTPKVLAYGVTVGFFGTLAYLIQFGMPAAGHEAILIMLGSLGTAWAGVIAYYFGSSSGSKLKTDALAGLAVQQRPRT